MTYRGQRMGEISSEGKQKPILARLPRFENKERKQRQKASKLSEQRNVMLVWFEQVQSLGY